MTSFDGGTVRARYEIDYSQAQQAAAQIKAIYQGIGQQATQIGAQISRAATPQRQGNAPTYAQEQRAVAALEAQQARLARQQGDAARAAELEAQAENRLTAALVRTDVSARESIALQRQLTSVQTQVARAAQTPTGQFAEGLKSGLTNVVGPAAAATAAIAAFGQAEQAVEQGFELRAKIDATQRSIALQVQGLRDSAVVFDRAGQFAARYQLTQEETNNTLLASVGILRRSKAATEDVLGTLLRLQQLSPEQGLEGAALALKELQSGSTTSLVGRFEVSRDAANKMKQEIAGGADAVLVLSRYLTDSGLGMEALDNRTQGATGKMNELRRASEGLSLALGENATGPGLAILNTRIETTVGLTRLLRGDTQEMGQSIVNAANQGTAAYNLLNIATIGNLGLVSRLISANQEHAASAQQAGQASELLSQAVLRSADADDRAAQASQGLLQATSDETKAKLDSQIASDQLAQEQATLERASALAARGLLGAGDQAVIMAQKYGIAADQAQFLINQQQKLDSAQALADQRKGEQTGGVENDARQFENFTNLQRARRAEEAADNKRLAEQRAADAKRLRDSENNLALARAKNSQQRIAVLNQELAQTTDQAERNAILAKIEQERASAAKRAGAGRISAAQSTGLQLQQVEENTQAQLARTQREGLERLADQQEDFDVRRSRSKEDFDRKIQSLLAHGQRAEAARLREQFAIDQRREQEDFDRTRRRTIRNNEEQLGDTAGRADLRTDQINRRAGLRGVQAAGVPALPGAGLPALPVGGGGAGARGAFTLNVQIAPSQIQIDGETIVTITWPSFQQLIDAELAAELGQVGITLPPGSGQSAVAGAKP